MLLRSSLSQGWIINEKGLFSIEKGPSDFSLIGCLSPKEWNNSYVINLVGINFSQYK